MKVQKFISLDSILVKPHYFWQKFDLLDTAVFGVLVKEVLVVVVIVVVLVEGHIADVESILRK
jgi:hypothetical protein